MKNIETDFYNAKKRAILFLGHINSVSEDEIKLFLDKFDIKYTLNPHDDIALVIESTILSPYQEQAATDAYRKKIPIYSVDQFEKLYAKELNSNSLLMSLKLSNNQKRLFRILHNPHLSDKLFLKLFSMYDWQNEGMFDNSDNMKISTLFAKRFFKKDRFDPAAYHSPVSIFETALISEDQELLEVMFDLPQIRIKRSRSGIKKPSTLKEAICLNPHTNEKTLKKAFRLNDKNLDFFLAQNSSVCDQLQQKLFERSDDEIKEALCKNINLSDDLFKKLLGFDTLWVYQKIDKKRVGFVEKPPAIIGENENISDEVAEILLSGGDEETLKNLCSNEALSRSQLQRLYNLENENFYPGLAANANTPTEILQKLFEKKDPKIDSFLALNNSTPATILKQLFKRDDFEINRHLALNESLPLKWLQQLQIDHRLMSYLKENPVFTQNILNNLGI